MTSNTDRNSTAAYSAYQAARTERETKEQAQAQALTAVAKAKLAAAELRDRNSRGDAKVTGLDLVTADAEVPRLEGLASNATSELELAKTMEAETLASHLVEDLTDRLAKASDIERADAITAIRSALEQLFTQIDNRNAVIRGAIEAAKGAGVVPNEANDDRITFGREQYLPGRHSIRVDGATASESVPEKEIMHVLTKALESTGYKLASPSWIEVRRSA